MITTVTLNTSIDRRYLVDGFDKGEIFRCKRYQATAGGKGLNVTKVIRDLGEDAVATGFVGGYNGQFIINQLNTMGICNDFVGIKEETRSCIAILSDDGSQTEILEAGPTVYQDELEKLVEKFSFMCDNSSIITISGSLPAGVPDDIYRKLIGIAAGKNVKVILDSSGSSLINALKAKPFLIKPNEDELKAVLGRAITCEDDIITAGKYLLQNGIEYVVVSLGKKGGMLFNDKFIYRAEIPEIKAVNPVGSGDSMVAGLAVGIKRGYEVPKLLAFASACGTANAMEEETGKVSLGVLEDVLENIKVTKTSLNR